jgi:O-antigen ligase/tetratricopeptide (TPR) repeat protein
MKKAKSPPRKVALPLPTTASALPTESARLSLLAAIGLAVLFVHLALSPLLFTRQTVEEFEYPKFLLLLTTALLLGMLGAWRGIAWSGKRWQNPMCELRIAALGALTALVRNPIRLGIGLFLLSALASTLTSVNPLTSWRGTPESYGGLQTILASTVLFIATGFLGCQATARRLLLAAVVPGAAVSAAYALLQFVRADPVSWSNVSGLGVYARPFGTMGHANFLAAYHVMTLPITLYFAGRTWGRGQRALTVPLAVVALASVLVIALSLSRGAWLALAGSGSFAVLMLLANIRWHWRPALPGLALLVLGGAGLVAIAGLGQEGFPRLLRVRTQQLLHSPSRLDLWQAGLSMFRARPAFGVGLDTFSLAHGVHRPADSWRQEWGMSYTRAHNEVIHILGTQGLLGLSAIIVLTAGVVVTGRRLWQRVPSQRPLLLAVLTGLVGFAVQDLFGFTVFPCGTLLLTLLALLAHWPESDGAESADSAAADRSWLLPALVAVNVLVGGLCWLNFLAPNGGAPGSAGLASLVLMLVVGSVSAVLVCLEYPRPRSVAVAWRDLLHSIRLGRLSRRALVCLGLQFLVLLAALALLDTLVVYPGRASVLCRTGSDLLPEQPGPAMSWLRQAVALDGSQDHYWCQLGIAAQMAAARASSRDDAADLLESARASLAEAVGLVPSSSQNQHNLGLALARLAKLGRVPPAIAFERFDEALTLDPYNVIFCGDAANAALQLGERERARAYAARAVAVEPQFSRCLAQLGFLAVQERQYAEGVRLLQVATQSPWQDDPAGEATVAWVNLAVADYRLGRFADAATAARRALQNAPHLPEVHYLLGNSLERLGERDEAIHEFREVLRQHPTHAGARQALERLHG